MSNRWLAAKVLLLAFGLGVAGVGSGCAVRWADYTDAAVYDADLRD